MSVFGISMVRDEQDIIGYTLPRMAAQLDQVIVADNMSTDDTREILDDIAKRMGNIEIVPDNELAYLQSQKMTALAEMAREDGATWIVPFDADEVWYCFGADLSQAMAEDAPWSVIHAQLFDHVATGKDDPDDPDPISRIGWKREDPLPLPKVIARILPGLVIEQGNHGARFPGDVGTLIDSGIVVHHYPYRSPEQMARKARNGAEAYAAAGDRLPSTAGQHWRDYGRFYENGGLEAITEIFETWFYQDNPEGLVYDPCPIRLPT